VTRRDRAEWFTRCSLLVELLLEVDAIGKSRCWAYAPVQLRRALLIVTTEKEKLNLIRKSKGEVRIDAKQVDVEPR